MTTYTDVKKSQLKRLMEEGFYFDDLKSKYESARLKGVHGALILFSSGKLLVQGKEENVKHIEELLKKLKIGKKVKSIEFVKETGTVIGSDEALKGDTFGGLVVAAVKANDKSRQDLLFAGVMDSKKLDDTEIPVIAERIKKVAKYCVVEYMPEKYNQYEKVTLLLNEMHKKAIDALGDADKIIVDQYPGCTLNSTTKAEQKYVEVAAASILARDYALKQLDIISAIVGFKVPKGSTHVKEALEKAKKKRLDFSKIVKINFNNVQKFL